MPDTAVDNLPHCRKCGEPFQAKRSNQLYCSPEHRPPNRSLRLTPAQAEVILQIAAQLSS